VEPRRRRLVNSSWQQVGSPPGPGLACAGGDLILIMHVLSCYPLQLIAQSSLQLPASRARRGGSEMDGGEGRRRREGGGKPAATEGGSERRRSNLAGRACNQSMGCRCWAGCWSVWAHTYFHSSLGDSFFPSHAILSSFSSRRGRSSAHAGELAGTELTAAGARLARPSSLGRSPARPTEAHAGGLAVPHDHGSKATKGRRGGQ
jgi:hypothetical protein